MPVGQLLAAVLNPSGKRETPGMIIATQSRNISDGTLSKANVLRTDTKHHIWAEYTRGNTHLPIMHHARFQGLFSFYNGSVISTGRMKKDVPISDQSIRLSCGLPLPGITVAAFTMCALTPDLVVCVASIMLYVGVSRDPAVAESMSHVNAVCRCTK